MKKMLLVLAMATSVFTAHAGSGSYVESLKAQSFSELRANYDVELENDQVWFGGTIVSILDTCMADAETVRTSEKLEIEEMDGDDFVVVGVDYLYKSIHGRRAMVDEDNGELYFKRDYSIPACQ